LVLQVGEVGMMFAVRKKERTLTALQLTQIWQLTLRCTEPSEHFDLGTWHKNCNQYCYQQNSKAYQMKFVAHQIRWMTLWCCKTKPLRCQFQYHDQSTTNPKYYFCYV
jgi:hypothetical protein